MANFVAGADGNLTAAATWNTVGHNLVSTSTAVTALTTGNHDTAVFVPAAAAVRGVLLKLGVRAAGSPTNTLTVHWRNSTAGTNVKTVVVNVSDLDPCDATQRNGGWYFFLFDATTTPNGADNYLIRCTLSATSTAVSLQTNGTANNFQRIVVLSATGAPGAGDDLYIPGVLDGVTNPATPGSRVVTMDQTAATDYGAAVSSIETPAVTVNKRGRLSWSTAANTIFRVSGMVTIYSGGELNVGTVATPIPIAQTAVFELDCATDNQFYVSKKDGAIFTMQGSPRTAGTNVVMCRLNTDEAAGQTILGVDRVTGWLSGDQVSIAATSATPSQHEIRTLAANALAGSIEVTAGLTHAHTGSHSNVLMNAEIQLLTHNVKFRSTLSTAMTAIDDQGGGTLDIDWTELQFCGDSAVAPSGALRFNATTGLTHSIRFSTFKDGEEGAITCTGNAAGFTAEDVNVYNFTVGTIASINVPLTNADDWTLRRVLLVAASSGGAGGFNLGDQGGTMADLGCVSATNRGFTLGDTDQRAWTIAGLNARTLGEFGIDMSGILGRGTISNFNCSHCGNGVNSGGISGVGAAWANLTFDTGNLVGNNGGCGIILRSSSNRTVNTLLRNVVMAGDVISTQTGGLRFDANGGMDFHLNWRCEGCSFGVGTAHTVADIQGTTLGTLNLTMTLVDCTLASGTELSSIPSTTEDGSYVAFQRKDASDTNHSVIAKRGTLAYDAVISHAGLPTLKMTPNSASVKLQSNAGARNKWLILAQTGQTITFTCPVRVDATYNGTAPRLVALTNPAIDIDTDTVIGTHPGGTGSFVNITGSIGPLSQNGVIEVIVDCDGTAGFINVAQYTAIP